MVLLSYEQASAYSQLQLLVSIIRICILPVMFQLKQGLIIHVQGDIMRKTIVCSLTQDIF